MKKSDVKIAATSDLHGFIRGLEDTINEIRPDIFIIAGDTHPCEIYVDADRWFTTEFFPMVRRLPCEVVAIPGNHDFWLSRLLSIGDNCLRDDGTIPNNFHLLCDSEITIHGVRIYGTPWVPWINGSWCFEASSKTLEYEFSQIPVGVDLLVTHSPPLVRHKLIDISTEVDESRWRHFGSRELTDRIGEAKPRYVICGHIHSGDHTPCPIPWVGGCGESLVYNVSRVNERYIPNFDIATISVAGK